jgi:O-antigen/teichoic acid export membrane protein
LLNIATNSIYSIQIGLQKGLRSNLWQLISTVLYVLVLLWVLFNHPSLKWVAAVNFLIPLLIALINTLSFFYTEKLHYQETVKVTLEEARLFLGKSSMFLVLQIAALLCFQTDALVIAHFLSFDDVAVFSVAAKLFSVPNMLLWVYLQLLWPAYSRALINKDWTWIRKSYCRSTLLSVLATIGFIGCVFLLKDILERYWLKNRLEIPYSLIIAYSCFVVVSVIDSNMSSILNGLNRIKIQVYLSVLMVLSNIILSILFVQKWGVSGVVWGSFASTLLMVIIFWIYLRRMLKNGADEIS